MCVFRYICIYVCMYISICLLCFPCLFIGSSVSVFVSIHTVVHSSETHSVCVPMFVN